MFSINELSACLSQKWLADGHSFVERNILSSRLGLPIEPTTSSTRLQLRRFAQAVVASAPTWDNPRINQARILCQTAGDIEAGLILAETTSVDDKHLGLLKAMILYDLAGLPGASSSYAARNGIDARLQDFFSRHIDSTWGRLRTETTVPQTTSVRDDSTTAFESVDALLESATGEIVSEAATRLQRKADFPAVVIDTLAKIVSDFSFYMTGDDVQAIAKLLKLRTANSSLSIIPALSSLSDESIRSIEAPLELWPAQVAALQAGLLDERFQSFGFAAPTGTGKTALTRILIANALAVNPKQKVLYVCPSRALVHQIASDLSDALKALNLKVIEAGAHLVVHELIPIAADDADVIVFTPERADLLLRVEREFLERICLIVVDEAHHIEQGTRGVLLEFYLWRLRKIIPPHARIVQLSAVAPNIAELTNWLAGTGHSESVVLDWRTSRLRVGTLERTKRGAAALNFSNQQPFTILPDGTLPSNAREGIAKLADYLSRTGIVLVLCQSPAAAEEVAELVATLRITKQATNDELSEKLDAWIERELYPESTLRDHYKKRVIFHHAQMPPRVRLVLEEAIRDRKVDVICATTTLAEGVNFPFSTVIVETLVSKEFELSPRALWNIAGRAGRFGVDTEGHCILFRPSLWEDRLKTFKLADYLKVRLVDIPPVKSALATGMERLEQLIQGRKIDYASLDAISLSEIKVDGKRTKEAQSIRALINIMRVGYAHANTSGLIALSSDSIDEIDDELLAARQMNSATRSFAKAIGSQQRAVISRATDDNPEFVEIAARVGWSLEAQHNLYAWLVTREDWQLEQFGEMVVGGQVRHFGNLGYLIGPLAKNLLAFEGQVLGGYMSFIAAKWIEGIPLANFQTDHGASFGLMISRIYGRMQYLLPWGMFGMHELIQYEAKNREIEVGDGVSALSILTAEGVPNFDALQLVLQLGVERVDATRLSQQYRRFRPPTDIVGWFVGSGWPALERVVRGNDRRRVDPILRGLHSRLREQANETS